jgi:F0F1-type ATP synthase assembly protein I
MNSNDLGTYLRNMSYAASAGTSGCSTVVVVLGALLLGLWVDSILGTRPVFTLILTLLSIPISLGLMLWIVLRATSRMTPPNIPKSAKQSSEGDYKD